MQTSPKIAIVGRDMLGLAMASGQADGGWPRRRRQNEVIEITDLCKTLHDQIEERMGKNEGRPDPTSQRQYRVQRIVMDFC